jgi:hypothetical protein
MVLLHVMKATFQGFKYIYSTLHVHMWNNILHKTTYTETAIHNHNKCQKLKLHFQFCQKNAFKKIAMNMENKLYECNKLPNKARKGEKMTQFKRPTTPHILHCRWIYLYVMSNSRKWYLSVLFLKKLYLYSMVVRRNLDEILCYV